MKVQKYEMNKYRSRNIDFFKRLSSDGYEEGGLQQQLKRQQMSWYKEGWSTYLSSMERAVKMRQQERELKEGLSKLKLGTSLVSQQLRLPTPSAGGPDLVPGQGTRSHMLQPRVHMLQLKILPATVNIQDPPGTAK